MSYEEGSELEQVRRSIKEAYNNNRISDEDHLLLEEFDLLLEHDAVGPRRHTQVLRYLHLIAKRADAHQVALSEILESTTAVRNILSWIKAGEYYDEHAETTYTWSDKNKTHYRSSLRKFGKIINNGDLPDPMELIYGGSKQKVSHSTPNPGDILLWNPDVVPLLRAANNARDRALIAVAWDSGARPSELEQLTYGDITQDGDFLKISVDGKNTPHRDIRLIISAPFLKKWLHQHHPVEDTDQFTAETPVWTRLDKPEQLRSFGDVVPRRVAPRTNVTKPTNLRNFRKSRASVLASRDDVDRGDLEERMGWVYGSQIVGVYVRRFGNSSDDNIARSDGLADKHLPDSDHEELPNPVPIRCPNCSRWTPKYDKTCIWCAIEFNPEKAEEAREREVESPAQDKARRDLIDMVTSGELTSDDVESGRKLADLVSQYPELLETTDELMDVMDRLNDDSEQNEE